MLLTCDEERVGNSGLSEHALYVARKELESLAATAVRVHQNHDSAGPTHLRIQHTWNRTQREVDVSEGEDKDDARRQVEGLLMHDQIFKRMYKDRLVPEGEKRTWNSEVRGCDSIQIDEA